VIFDHLLAIAGAVIVFTGAFGWALEPATAPEVPTSRCG
jgi:hypothetical protein